MSFTRYPAYKDSGVEWLGEVPEHWAIIQSRRMFRARRSSQRRGRHAYSIAKIWNDPAGRVR
jgi:type I restriction enzyme S subunit